MSIFSKKFEKDTAEKDVSFVGVTMPLQTNQRLTLHSMATGQPKSSILREQAEKWVETQSLPIDTCITTLAKNAAMAYQSSAKKSISKFCDSVRDELLKKGIEREYIDAIISQILQQHGENK